MSGPLSDDVIEDLGRLLAVVKEPWRYQEKSDAYTHIVREGAKFILQLQQERNGTSETRARLIAAAVDALPALLTERRTAQAEIERLRREVDELKSFVRGIGINCKRMSDDIKQVSAAALQGAPHDK